MAANRSVNGNNPVNSTIAAGDTSTVGFEVLCKATVGAQIAFTRNQEI